MVAVVPSINHGLEDYLDKFADNSESARCLLTVSVMGNDPRVTEDTIENTAPSNSSL